eukprot:c7375_g1_i2.p1 GENE.c7375_g1_i2~~c7375_g1_i2.p1  ORF type:complete len:113 (+),score=17.07 c7375_g1_i2:40-378(+)
MTARVLSIRVVREHVMRPAQHKEFLEHMIKLRTLAKAHPGFQSAETMKEVGGNPAKYIIHSKWNTVTDFEAWIKNPQRLEVTSKVKEMCLEDESHLIYIRENASASSLHTDE